MLIRMAFLRWRLPAMPIRMAFLRWRLPTLLIQMAFLLWLSSIKFRTSMSHESIEFPRIGFYWVEEKIPYQHEILVTNTLIRPYRFINFLWLRPCCFINFLARHTLLGRIREQRIQSLYHWLPVMQIQMAFLRWYSSGTRGEGDARRAGRAGRATPGEGNARGEDAVSESFEAMVSSKSWDLSSDIFFNCLTCEALNFAVFINHSIVSLNC